MNFNEYQIKSRKFAIYRKKNNNLIYPLLGLIGESGEIAEKIKRVIRGDTKFDKKLQIETAKELGDVLWYLSQLASELNIKLEDVANNNIKKLESRKERNKIKGKGDNR
jgi:NTP pyrophosphatase (non-canonical NTP hydrolase)